MNLSAFCVEYLRLKQLSLSPLTFENYSLTINKLIIPYFGGDVELRNITAFSVQGFVLTLSQRYKPVTVRRKYSVLRALLHKAAAFGLCDGSAILGIELPKPQPACIEIFSDDSIFFLLSAIQNEPLMWRLLFSLALDTGARRGEIAALRWEDWNKEESFITISHSCYKTNGGQALKKPKSGLSRVVSLSSSINILMMRFQRLTGRLNGFIFSFDGLKPVHVDTITHYFCRFLARNGIKKRRFHALRHTCATILLQNGADIKTVSARLGHSSLTVTELYVHSCRAADRRAADILDKVFYG